ncbi:hypothetical protein ACF05L_33545 [Streptomyces bobili]|uniref:hypothetical protein n=1 Tax=Streptomyces bobili TaxID=67280 RepID=UPI0036F9F363
METVHGWDDIVLSAGGAAQLTEVCERVAHTREEALKPPARIPYDPNRWDPSAGA